MSSPQPLIFDKFYIELKWRNIALIAKTILEKSELNIKKQSDNNEIKDIDAITSMANLIVQEINEIKSSKQILNTSQPPLLQSPLPSSTSLLQSLLQPTQIKSIIQETPQNKRTHSTMLVSSAPTSPSPADSPFSFIYDDDFDHPTTEFTPRKSICRSVNSSITSTNTTTTTTNATLNNKIDDNNKINKTSTTKNKNRKKPLKTKKDKTSTTVTTTTTGIKPKRGRPIGTKPEKCMRCFVVETPEWRKGKLDDNSSNIVDLCNACGLRFLKKNQKELKSKDSHSINRILNDDTTIQI